MSDEHKQYASTAAATLEAHILSVHSAKSEAEWWAQREILRLRAEVDRLRAENINLFARLDKAYSFISRADWMQFFEEEHDAAAALKEPGDE